MLLFELLWSFFPPHIFWYPLCWVYFFFTSKDLQIFLTKPWAVALNWFSFYKLYFGRPCWLISCVSPAFWPWCLGNAALRASLYFPVLLQTSELTLGWQGSAVVCVRGQQEGIAVGFYTPVHGPASHVDEPVSIWPTELTSPWESHNFQGAIWAFNTCLPFLSNM